MNNIINTEFEKNKAVLTATTNHKDFSSFTVMILWISNPGSFFCWSFPCGPSHLLVHLRLEGLWWSQLTCLAAMPSLFWGFCSSPRCLTSHGMLHWAASQPDDVKSFKRERMKTERLLQTHAPELIQCQVHHCLFFEASPKTSLD